MPKQRLIDEALWEQVKERQQGLRRIPEFHERQRPRMLPSYLLKCGCCGGGFSKISQNRYGCSPPGPKARATTAGQPDRKNWKGTGAGGAAIAPDGPRTVRGVLR